MAAVYVMTLAGFALFPLYSPISTVVAGFSNYYHCLSHEKIVRIIIEDTFRNIGLHLASRISRSMTYQNTFGLNILTMVV